jgi:hypothetical protein
MRDKAQLPFDAIRPALDKSWRTGHQLAFSEFEAFLAWFRIQTKQSWLGIAGEPSTQFGRSYLREAGKEGVLIAYGPEQKVVMRNGNIGATSAQVAETVRHLEASSGVPPEASLLADARFLARDSDLVDGHRAVLAAAMACEIAAKKALRDATSAERRPAIDLLLRRRSSVPELVTDIAEVAVDRSLGKEKPELLARIKELNTCRNRVVHTGTTVEQQDAFHLVQAAEDLFEWLSGLSSNH